mmetsp:Transcript_48897/g.95905  ORF Transcript_48897/g.95905 Transcript_48897/m.95905 type:complete len:381 (+) Transcript_48897:549-1691(+)
MAKKSEVGQEDEAEAAFQKLRRIRARERNRIRAREDEKVSLLRAHQNGNNLPRFSQNRSQGSEPSMLTSDSERETNVQADGERLADPEASEEESRQDPCHNQAFNVLQMRVHGFETVCATSYVTPGKGCSGKVSFARAQELCASMGTGVRVCTSDELHRGEALGSGCHYDWMRVWAAKDNQTDASPSSSISPGLQCSSDQALTQAGGPIGERHWPRICSGVNEQHHVRCCATSTAPATAKPVLPAPVPPKTCKELNWSAGSTSASGVCGASQVVIGSRCLDKKVPFLVAQSLCLHIGARLCTSAELSAGSAAGSGCGLDDKPVWTASEMLCDEGEAIAQAGAASGEELFPPVCSKFATKHNVRCCSDETFDFLQASVNAL